MTLQQLFETAIQHQAAGRLREAESCYRQILSLDPKQPNVLHRLARIIHQQGDHASAETCLRQALQINPNSADYRIDLALVLLAQDRTLEAIEASEKALTLRPDDPSIFSNLGYMLHLAGRPHDGINACQKAIALRPNYPEAYNNLGINLADLGHFEQAADTYQKALSLNPSFPQALNNLAIALDTMNRPEEALAACRKAIALDPNYADAHNNLGNALQNLAQHDQAIAAYRQAITLAPNHSVAFSNYLFGLCYHPATTASQLLNECRRWAQSVATPNVSFTHIDRSPNRPLRIGYVSGDLRFHSVAFFLLPLLEAHDKSNFHITCYPNNIQSDKITARLRTASDQWHPIAGLADQAAFDLIRRDAIDILIDLAGHTSNNRLPLFAKKPAPIQISWLGYPATTGLDAIDYRITDPITDPPTDNPALHSEKLLRLPQTAWCFSPLSGSPPIAPPPHLANHHITFGSLNNFAKLNPDNFSLWARLLQSIPNSRLAIKTSTGPQTTAHIHHLFAQFSVTPDRLDFLPKLPTTTGHLERYQRFDIALDTFPYNGTTTTCEALWMGVPVITRAGDRHASRVGQSILTTLGLNDLIAHSPDQFLTIAQKLAADSPRLQSLRTTLRPRMQSSPLMDAPQFARHFESIYRQIWQEYASS